MDKNIRISTRYVALPLVAAVIAGTLAYLVISAYVIKQAEDRVHDVLMAQRGLHHYIQRVMHPAFFSAREAHYIREDYYAPEIFSSSFMVRNLHQFYNEERTAAGMEKIYYKMAADNPRNPLNKADDMETRLLRMFNEQRKLKEYRKIVSVDGQKMLVYALPFLETNEKCLTCHGRREDAPLGLQVKYPGNGGFGDKIGNIRAIEIIKAPINNELTIVTIASSTVVAGLLTLVMLMMLTGRLKVLVSERTVELEKEIEERKQAEQEVMNLNCALEKRVSERTEQLERAIVDQTCLNETLEKKTSDLAEANECLEAFTMTVSHDLRAPVRHIRSFSNILIEEHASELNKEGGYLLQRISSECEHMDNLITSMLEFSRIDRHVLQKELIDTKKLVETVIAGIKEHESHHDCEVLIGDISPCYADKILLRQVFSNLLENACKFTRPVKMARIEVGQDVKGDETVYFVKDNGVGFDMQFAERLFKVFQRMHGKEFEGTGVGLATVKRILERHGGRIWVESLPDQGTTFWFTVGL